MIIVIQVGPTCAFYAFANALVATQNIPKQTIHSSVQLSIQLLRPRIDDGLNKEQNHFTRVGEIFTNEQAKAMIQTISKHLSLSPQITEANVDQLEQTLATLNENEIILLPIQLSQNIHWISIFRHDKKNHFINPNHFTSQRLTRKKTKKLIKASKQVKHTTFNWYNWRKKMVLHKNEVYRYKLSITKRILLPTAYTTFIDDLFRQPYTHQFLQNIHQNSKVTFKDLHLFKISFAKKM